MELLEQMVILIMAFALFGIQKKERLITPEEQNIIRLIFIRQGIHTDPLFDQYVEQYDW